MRQAEAEQLRQERETFEFNKRTAREWSRLRLSLGYGALIVFLAVFALCTFVILAHDQFGANVDKWALSVLAIDIVGLAGTVIKLVFDASQARPLTPVTQTAPPPPGTL
jgi:hypothetical protein